MIGNKRLENNTLNSLRPGIISVFICVYLECSTSSDETSIRIVISMGKTTRLSTSNNRSSPGFRSDVGIM